MLLFFSIFGFIGITVLIFLWTAKGFGAPPLIFKVFASFIALGFIFMGFGAPLSALMGSRRSEADMDQMTYNELQQPHASPKPHHQPSANSAYDCPNCGAHVEGAEVSPSGDIKCGYCKKWWNIHG